ncbi:conserved hypothetical protein [Ricinus communis]|uniref:Uncharacterized protein n=1 Tax=Ricinus communis TaxID=3988 RepID=B9TMX2_RICCO|nr:conserved hypothetical protein [Ricinus communis]
MSPSKTRKRAVGASCRLAMKASSSRCSERRSSRLRLKPMEAEGTIITFECGPGRSASMARRPALRRRLALRDEPPGRLRARASDLLHCCERIGEARARRAVFADARRHARALRIARRVGVALRHVARGAAQDRLDVARRQVRVCLQQQRAQARQLRRSRRRPAEHTPAVVGRGAVEGGVFTVDLATGRNGQRDVGGVRQHADQPADVGHAAARVDQARECARVVRCAHRAVLIDEHAPR